jgi:membrane protease YdiL (CAAX protease family)
MMYIRFPLSLRNVEDLLYERGVAIPLLLRYGKWAAVLLAAVMFSLGHLTNGIFLDRSLLEWIEGCCQTNLCWQGAGCPVSLPG